MTPEEVAQPLTDLNEMLLLKTRWEKTNPFLRGPEPGVEPLTNREFQRLVYLIEVTNGSR